MPTSTALPVEYERRASVGSCDPESPADVEATAHVVTEAKDPGVARIEALYKVLGKRGKISVGVLYASMLLMACGTALDSSTTYTCSAFLSSSPNRYSSSSPCRLRHRNKLVLGALVDRGHRRRLFHHRLRQPSIPRQNRRPRLAPSRLSLRPHLLRSWLHPDLGLGYCDHARCR